MDHAMKRFFAKASNIKAFIPVFPPFVPPISTTTTHTTGLLPKDVLPPVPHPRPYDHIALLVTSGGLLLRPHLEAPTARPVSHVRISWGNPVKVEELEGDGEGDGMAWNESVIVYGIVGILELFSSSVFTQICVH
jgi:phosphatidylinositol 4-phosphatase